MHSEERACNVGMLGGKGIAVPSVVDGANERSTTNKP